MSQYAASPALAVGDDVLNPFSFIGNSVGIPAFLMTMLYPQAMEMAKRYPRLWKILSGAVAIQLTYSYTQAKLKKLINYLISLCASSIKVYEGDELLGCFFRWLDRQGPSVTHDQVVTAQSLQYKNITRATESQEDLTNTPEGVEPNNFTIQRKYRVRMFRHNGRFFWLSRAASVATGTVGRDGQIVKKRGLTIWTLGGSIKPIAAILEEAVENHSNDGEKSATTLYIPGNGGAGHWDYDGTGAPTLWKKHAVKPCRPLDTVYLDGDQRESIQRDVAHFLYPDTATRYRSKGIPHRRGYMFHGPPGNGKSSLAMALAGHFGLNVYSLSLRDANMNDAYLGNLFNVLPPTKVLVLLEDIDSAGLKREEEFEDDESTYDENAVWTDAEYVPPPTRRRRARPRVTNVTLSGVLNALDGISAPEGHIVVMTTNAPDSLDKALIRPGRIDLKVEFKNASPKQLYDIFHRMYREEKDLAGEFSPNTDSSASSPTPSSATSEIDADEKVLPKHQNASPYGLMIPLVQHKPLSSQRLHDLASRFSLSIPAGQHSLASIQNYLLGRVDEPHRAVEEASAWAEEETREKEEAERKKAERRAKRELKKQQQKEAIRRLKGFPPPSPPTILNGEVHVYGQASDPDQVLTHLQIPGEDKGQVDGQEAMGLEVGVDSVQEAKSNGVNEVSPRAAHANGATSNGEGGLEATPTPSGYVGHLGNGNVEQVVYNGETVTSTDWDFERNNNNSFKNYNINKSPSANGYTNGAVTASVDCNGDNTK